MNTNPKVNKNRNVVLLGWVSFLNDLSSDMIMPVLPMFIVSLGGGPLAVGFLGGARELLASIFKIVSGYRSDRAGKRKPFVVYGYLSSTVCKIFLAFSRSWLWAVVFYSLERVGKGLRTAARDALIADSLPNRRGRGFGLHRAMDTAGAIMGAVIVLFLYRLFQFGFRGIIIFASVIALLSLIPLYFVEEVPGGKHELSFRAGMKELPPSLKKFVIVSALFSLANFSYMFFIIRAQQFFKGTFTVTGPLIGYIFFNIFYAIFSFPAGLAADRWGKGKVVFGGYLLFAAASYGFAVFSSLPSVVLLFAVYGISCAFVDANQRALVSDLAGGNLKGISLGFFHSVTSAASFLGNILAGFIWKILSLKVVFIYGAVLALFASVFIMPLCGIKNLRHR